MKADCHFSSFLLLSFGASWWLQIMAEQAGAHLRGEDTQATVGSALAKGSQQCALGNKAGSCDSKNTTQGQDCIISMPSF